MYVGLEADGRPAQLLKRISSCGSHEQAQQTVRQILALKILQQIYKTSAKDQLEIIELWQKSPVSCSDIIRERVEQKYGEILESRNKKATFNWEQVQLNNFHRSLDHRSFYFKKNEKQHHCPSKFLKEPDERLAPDRAHEALFYLNSLAQLTSYEPLSAGRTVPFIAHLHDDNRRLLPLFSLWLPDRAIHRETLAYLLHYSQLATQINQSERAWVSRSLIMLSNALFAIQVQPTDFNMLVTSLPLIKQEVLLIEQSIFDVNFSYLQSFQEKDEVKPSQQEPPDQNNNNS